MPALAARRPSLCLFCAFAASARPRAVPLVQRASRSDTQTKPVRRTKSVTQIHRPLLRKTYELPPDRSLAAHLAKFHKVVSSPDYLASLSLSPERFDEAWSQFTAKSKTWSLADDPEIKSALRDYDPRSGKAKRLNQRLRYLFFAQIYGAKFTQAEIENQKELANLCYPVEWYPITRSMKRSVHLHVGPTNSGKTYHALKRLESADRGIYLGPLRLLAHEVYTRLAAKGIPTALVTGEEQRMPEDDAKMWSCTVEMAPLNAVMDVAVIDEIQMISHPERGWAWTQAFLGMQAAEIHLCGEARTVPLIKALCASVGDDVTVHKYKRLSPLKCDTKSLKGNLRGNLQKGDCIVAFTVLGIHALRKLVESATNKKCAMVYGSLPPETRAQQARLFNDPNNDYDFLVASDAVGMGLNLSIKRIIFESTVKNNGQKYVPLEISEVKQIAGRAGRYKSAHEAVTEGGEKQETGGSAPPAEKPTDQTQGLVTTLEAIDFPHLRLCMQREPAPIKQAGLFPPVAIIERFANYFPPGTPFSYIMLRLHEISQLDNRFFLCSLKDQLNIADTIQPIAGLSIAERITICNSPSNARDETDRLLIREIASHIATKRPCSLLDLSIPLEHLDLPPSHERAYLWKLEHLHKSLVLYLWLSYRFPQILITRGLAIYAKGLVEDQIEKTLRDFSYTQLKRVRAKRQQDRADAMRRMHMDEDAEHASRDGEAEPANADLEVPVGISDIPKDGPKASKNVSQTEIPIDAAREQRPKVAEAGA